MGVITNFPDGISSQGMLVGSGIPPTTGKTFYVRSGGGINGYSGDGSSMDFPLATLASALTQCVAAHGDVVVLLPGHAESLAASTAVSKAGVQIIGLGVGGLRPAITFITGAGATLAVSAANVRFSNIVFIAGILSCAAAITIGTAADVMVDNCEFRDSAANLNFLTAITSSGGANTANRLRVINCRWFGLGTTSVTSFILSANAMDGLVMADNTVVLARTATAAALLTVTTGVLTNLICDRNSTNTKQTATTGGGLIDVGGSTSTGNVRWNHQQTLGASTDILFTTTSGLGAFENRVSGATGASGFLIPATDS